MLARLGVCPVLSLLYSPPSAVLWLSLRVIVSLSWVSHLSHWSLYCQVSHPLTGDGDVSLSPPYVTQPLHGEIRRLSPQAENYKLRVSWAAWDPQSL